MKKVVVLLLIVSSCSLKNSKDEYITNDLIIRDNNRQVIEDLEEPKVSYILEKDDEEYLDISDFPLTKKDDLYIINLKLLTNSTYKFTKFNITSNGKIIYILDSDSNNNIGFRVNNDGMKSQVNVYLKRVDNLDFDDVLVNEKEADINFNESSTIGYVDLTFKVSSNVENAQFKIYMYSVYWKLGATLNNNGVFDMDTGKEYSPIDDGDNEAWGVGNFKIETVNSQGEEVTIVGTTEEWNKKHIVLTL